MTRKDEKELIRLCAVLEKLDAKCAPSPEAHETLVKAALALQRVFLAGERKTLEQQHKHLGAPLTPQELAHLKRMGIKTQRKKKPQPAGGAYFLPGAGKKSAHP